MIFVRNGIRDGAFLLLTKYRTPFPAVPGCAVAPAPACAVAAFGPLQVGRSLE